MTDHDPQQHVAPVTVMFADMSGSKQGHAGRGDETAFNVASAGLEFMAGRVTAAAGRVVKKLGDAILAVFDAPEQALTAAVAIHEGIEARDSALHDDDVHVRIGICSGTAVVEAGDVYGDVVNVAARLVGLAGADEIFLSGKVYERLSARLRSSVRLIGQLTLRNRPTAVLVYQYVWERDDMTVSVGARPRGSTSTLELTHDDQLFVVGLERPRLTIGRGADNDLAIDHPAVSRHHAEIGMRGDKFLLIDRSTNGTYVFVDQGPMQHVSREEITFSGSGRIVLGEESAPELRYRITSC